MEVVSLTTAAPALVSRDAETGDSVYRGEAQTCSWSQVVNVFLKSNGKILSKTKNCKYFERMLLFLNINMKVIMVFDVQSRQTVSVKIQYGFPQLKSVELWSVLS